MAASLITSNFKPIKIQSSSVEMWNYKFTSNHAPFDSQIWIRSWLCLAAMVLSTPGVPNPQAAAYFEPGHASWAACTCACAACCLCGHVPLSFPPTRSALLQRLGIADLHIRNPLVFLLGKKKKISFLLQIIISQQFVEINPLNQKWFQKI